MAEVPSTPISAPGFDYRDAGVGAIALGAALLATADALAIRRSRGAASPG